MKKFKVFAYSTLGVGLAGVIASAIAIPLLLNKGGVSAEDKQNVDKINELIKGQSFDTMTQLVAYLSLTEDIDLEALNASNNNQYVWDRENNVVFVMNEQGGVAYAPTGYTLNTNKHQIWKMVKLATTNANGKTEAFVASSDYGQYLRELETTPSEVVFSSSIDTGFNLNLNLKYNKPDAISYTPIVATNKANLEITGTLGDIDHYGHAKSITVTQIPDEHSYNEYGTVDGSIILASNGKYVGKPGSAVTDIIVASDTASVTLHKDTTTEEYAKVGSISKTKEVTKTFDDLVKKDESYKEEEKPKEEERPVDPTPTTRYAGGLGTIGSPYIISTPDQLMNCAEDVSGDSAVALTTSKTLHFILSADIDMTGKEFIPIGSETKPFYGTFDGQDHTISNLKIKKDTSITGKKVFAGLFGWVKGVPIDGCNKQTIWNTTEKKVNYDTCLTQYSTCVTNVTIENIDNTAYAEGDTRYIGGIAGCVSDSLIYNCHVKSGNIKGKKHMGGIAGTMSNSLFYDCSTGSGLTIEATEYNVGGICGSASADADIKSDKSCDVFGYCVNNATVKAINKFEGGGNVSGIVAIASGSVATMGTVIDNCTNNGTIYSECTVDGKLAPSPSGIASDAHAVYVASNCTNNGDIIVKNVNTSNYASGLLSYFGGIVYKGRNNGSVSGKANYMSGIVAHQSSGWYFDTHEFYDVINNGTIQNDKTGGITGPILAESQYTDIKLHDKVYADVDALNNDIGSNGAVSITLTNVTVQNTEGTLNIQPSILSVTSDRKVCSNVAISGSSVTINMPDTNITIDGDHSSTNISFYGKNSNLTVNSEASLNSVIIGGENSQLINNGKIETVSMTNRCTDSINNEGGTIGKIGFDNGTLAGSTPLLDKHFTNKGTIHTKNRECHTISTVSPDVKVTIENYGTIKNENSWHLFLFYTNEKCVIKSYAGSVTEVTGQSSNLYIAWEDIYSYYQEAKGQKPEAKVIDHGVEHKWTDYTYKIINIKIED